MKKVRPKGLNPVEVFHHYMPGPPPDLGCWDWVGPKTSAGYGHYYVGPAGANEHFYAHRMSHEIYIGPITAGQEVLHDCDRPTCVNPAHLIAGTHRQNMTQAFERGLFPPPPGGIKGEQHGNAKLTEDDVRAIRADERTGREIAADYGISQQTVSLIRNGKLWKHVA